MLFDLVSTGHHLQYLSQLARYWHRVRPPGTLELVVSREFVERHGAFARWVETTGPESGLSLTPVDAGPAVQVSSRRGQLKRDRDQLWAEAVARHDKGQAWKVVPGDALWKALERHRVPFLTPDFWEEVVAAWLAEHEPEEITIAEVLTGALDVEPRHAMRKGAETRLGPILTRLGWEHAARPRKAGGRSQTWRRKA